MSILTKLFPKKEKLKAPRPSNIKCNYACEDADLEWSIKAYLNGTRTAKECLQDFIERMAYRDCLHMKENEAIFPIAEDFLEGATWKTEWTADCGDYNPHRPEPWLRCIYTIYDSMLMDIQCSENLLKDWHKEITTDAVMQVTNSKSITPEVYENREELATKRDEVKAIIDAGNFTPKEALLLVKANWNLLYPYQSTYEAIEYCIASSENHTEPKYFDSAFRDFGYQLGTLYRKAKEK